MGPLKKPSRTHWKLKLSHWIDEAYHPMIWDYWGPQKSAVLLITYDFCTSSFGISWIYLQSVNFMPCNCGMEHHFVFYVAIMAQKPLGRGYPRIPVSVYLFYSILFCSVLFDSILILFYSTYLSICLYLLSIYLSLSIYLLSAYLSIYLSFYLSVYLKTNLFCKTSAQFGSWKLQNAAFLRDFLQIIWKLKAQKQNFSARCPTNLEVVSWTMRLLSARHPANLTCH